MKKITAILAVIILIGGCRKDSLPEPIPTKPLKDIDGNGYDTVKIANQFWMKQNLTTSHYRNGDPIPEVTSNAVWSSLTTGAWCWYKNDSATYAATYGKLYNWFAVNDPRGLAPAGWHVASEAEWTFLSNVLGGKNVSGRKIKESGITHWLSPNAEATNSSGLTCLPGGYRQDSGAMGNSEGFLAEFWTSSPISITKAWQIILNANDPDMYIVDYNNKQAGMSVRCIKN